MVSARAFVRPMLGKMLGKNFGCGKKMSEASRAERGAESFHMRLQGLSLP